jgi:FlaA1/EpsC-like NDP-sugar epimerase
VVAEYALRLEPYELSRSFVVLFAIYAWILLCLFRINAERVIGVMQRRFGTGHFVMVVGSSDNAHRLGEALETSSNHGIRLIGFLGEEPSHVELSRSYI